MDLLVVCVGLAMAVGIVGTVLPLVPGLPVVWGAALVYGIAAGFSTLGWAAFAVITILFAAGIVAGIVLPSRGLAGAGAPRSTMLAALGLAVVGFFVLPVIGLPVGAVSGVLLAERRRLGDWKRGWASSKRVLVGFGLGALAQFGAGVAMAGIWAAWALLD